MSEYCRECAKLADRIAVLEAALRQIEDGEFDGLDEGVTPQGIARGALDSEVESRPKLCTHDDSSWCTEACYEMARAAKETP